ncbi:hypothetical protein LUW77_14970 [Streptomyces radiopugnans]|nr:hypothetical protein LUW77_14970 [Streptomyces radiopugnans]
MSRRSPLAARLARLEAAARVNMWTFTLTDGRTVEVPIEVVLDILGEGLPFVLEPDADYPQASRDLLLIAQADDTAETSLLGRTVVQIAREARRQREGKGTCSTRTTGDADG